jgi:membrane-bound ClpP family serine protease
MDKQEITVNCSGSGVKTLKILGTIFIVAGYLCITAALVGLVIFVANFISHDDTKLALFLLLTFLPSALGAITFGVICQSLSSIAKTSLIQQTLLEQQYKFKEKYTQKEAKDIFKLN